MATVFDYPARAALEADRTQIQPLNPIKLATTLPINQKPQMGSLSLAVVIGATGRNGTQCSVSKQLHLHS